SGVVTAAWATRHPAVALLISGCFHRDRGGQEAIGFNAVPSHWQAVPMSVFDTHSL
ncbi:hypothetical protein KUCAC02_029948, partial [Chaenocephalus aceratus]